MGLFPAATLSVRARNAAERTERARILNKCIDAWLEPRLLVDDLLLPSADATLFEVLAQRLDDLPSRRRSGIRSSHVSMPSISVSVFINHRGTESVCSPDERAFLLSLLDDRVADTVSFTCGPPSAKRSNWLGIEPGTIVGRRAHVALKLLESAYASTPDGIVGDLERLLAEQWDMLDAIEDRVELTYAERPAFLAECAALPYFETLRPAFEAAAKQP
jgi:hypothetical protein